MSKAGIFLLCSLASAALITGCNSSESNTASGNPGAAATSGSTTTAATTHPPGGASAPTPSPASPTSSQAQYPNLVGSSCEGATDGKICLGVHFVSYEDSSGTPAASRTQTATISKTVNQLWSQCNIAFQFENYEAVDPTQSGLDYGAQSQNELDQIRQTYENPTNELLVVTTGPWDTSVNGWTAMPGAGIYGSILEAGIVDYGGGIIYAHELGHYLGLVHVPDASDLMDAIIYTSSTTLTPDQCQTAEQTATSDWSKMLR